MFQFFRKFGCLKAVPVVWLLGVAGCATQMDLTAHVSDTDLTMTGVMDLEPSGNGRLAFAAPQGPNCDGLVVPNTVRTPERLEGQIQCDDGRSGAVRLFVSSKQAVGSGRLGREPITFRATKADGETTDDAARALGLSAPPVDLDLLEQVQAN